MHHRDYPESYSSVIEFGCRFTLKRLTKLDYDTPVHMTLDRKSEGSEPPPNPSQRTILEIETDATAAMHKPVGTLQHFSGAGAEPELSASLSPKTGRPVLWSDEVAENETSTPEPAIDRRRTTKIDHQTNIEEALNEIFLEIGHYLDTLEGLSAQSFEDDDLVRGESLEQDDTFNNHADQGYATIGPRELKPTALDESYYRKAWYYTDERNRDAYYIDFYGLNSNASRNRDFDSWYDTYSSDLESPIWKEYWDQSSSEGESEEPEESEETEIAQVSEKIARTGKISKKDRGAVVMPMAKVK